MNVSFSSSAANSVWSLLASRASAAGSTSASTYASTSTGTTSQEAAAAPADRPPPPPSQFDCAMSTSQFAGMMGPPPGGDPIASLDEDEDGSVSSGEFGLEDASEDVQQLFSAIDADGSGDLSTSEIDGFREQMMAADAPADHVQSGPPMGPPPGAQADGGHATASGQQVNVSSFLQQLAQRYASLMADSEGEGEGSVAVSATA